MWPRRLACRDQLHHYPKRCTKKSQDGFVREKGIPESELVSDIDKPKFGRSRLTREQVLPASMDGMSKLKNVEMLELISPKYDVPAAWFGMNESTGTIK